MLLHVGIQACQPCLFAFSHLDQVQATTTTSCLFYIHTHVVVSTGCTTYLAQMPMGVYLARVVTTSCPCLKLSHVPLVGHGSCHILLMYASNVSLCCSCALVVCDHLQATKRFTQSLFFCINCSTCLSHRPLMKLRCHPIKLWCCILESNYLQGSSLQCLTLYLLLHIHWVGPTLENPCQGKMLIVLVTSTTKF